MILLTISHVSGATSIVMAEEFSEVIGARRHDFAVHVSTRDGNLTLTHVRSGMRAVEIPGLAETPPDTWAATGRCYLADLIARYGVARVSSILQHAETEPAPCLPNT